MSDTLPKFRSSTHLLNHIQSILNFYLPRCEDKDKGGFYHCYRDDGYIYDKYSRHLVSSTRFIINFSQASLLFPTLQSRLLSLIRHGIHFLRQTHLNPLTKGYAWTLNLETNERDDRNLTYGLVYVLLAYSYAFLAGMIEVKDFIEETYQLLDRMMWEESAGLYADERSPDWSILNPYRGQNCNMHAVEAHLAAYRATQDPKHLHRAKLITQNMCQRQSKLCEKYTSHNFIYEHYLEDWSAPDLLYNKDNPLNMFKPWGFQPGHMVEWSRLLLDLHVISPEEWYIGRAIEFFKLAVKYGWDEINEGMIYSFEPSSGAFPCDKDKYKWVQAETFATAANLVLFDPKNANFYWDWYDRVWKYAWRVFIDHEKGGWYRILNEKNEKYDDLKSPPGKVDYHSIGACVSCLAVFQKL